MNARNIDNCARKMIYYKKLFLEVYSRSVRRKGSYRRC